ncbi:cell wall metabolism sensor histidine kinase WalK [Kutzneria sp. 744]|uniref:sensor histidine kinase n=1 Tax=Kutzneria sp. (strain 744) TaxID=345341 RepID=UPI0003EECAFF|nr:HAMP domain-containing sensor histidine kinase [Kutzneria sp. 744]EWM14422.1 sensor histidine kinase [Kutzneria sp. 744]
MGRLTAAWRRLRLGTQLALALGALALVVFGLVGVVTTSLLHQYLDTKLSDQLSTTLGQFKATGNVNPSPGKFGHGSVADHDPPVGVTVEFSPGNNVKLTDSTSHPPVDGQQLIALAARALVSSPLQHPEQEVEAGGVRYRFMAVTSVNTPLLKRVAVVGLSEGDTEATIRRMIMVNLVTFGVALVVLVLVGQQVLRRGLRPLADMSSTAHTVASTDLTAKSVDLSVRAKGEGGGIEVEELRSAFNVMIDHIDHSLVARSAAEQRLRQFVADASHELRTPLTSIRGYADLFAYAAANEPAERERHLARMREEAGRMSLLLDDLLLLARLDAAEAPLRPEPVDLVEIAVAAADGFQAARPDHPFALEVEPSALPMIGDPMRLRQVLDNLLTNAAVHTDPGTPVTLRLRTELGWAVAEVADGGPGISPENQARVFDRFYRVDDSRTRRSGGTGLGLSVVHSLVTAHGGAVTLQSRPGATAFTVRFPLSARQV